MVYFGLKGFKIIWLSKLLSVPDEGYSRNVPDEGYSRNVPGEGYSRNVPDEGYSSNVPDEGYSRCSSWSVLRYLHSHINSNTVHPRCTI